MKNLNFLTDLRNSNQVMTRLRPGNNQVKTTLRFIAILTMLTVGVGNAWADYTVGFATSGSDVITSGGNYVSTATRSGSTYIESNGLRFGKGSGTGSITVTLTSSGTYVGQIRATKITLKDVLRYGSDVSVNVKTTITYTDDATKEDNYTAPTSAGDHDITLNSSKTIKSVKIESTSNGKRFYCKGFTVVAAAAPSYTITATRNNNDYGTVSVTGTTITATPNSGYRVMSGTDGYTVTSGSATVVNNGDNTFTVTPSSNCTVQINFESKGCTDHGASSITGGALSDADHGPLHAYYDYSTSQILYTKSDLDLAAGKKGTIKSIYFEYSGAAAMAARTIKIYMANTDLSSLTTSNYVPYASFTQVYSGTFSCGSAGWYEITLDTPFDYNGAGQLAVMIDDNTNTYESSKSFKYHSATGKQIYKRQDDTDIDPASWTPASAIDYRPNTKFCIQEADMVQSTVTWVAGNNPSFGSQTDYEGTALSAPGTPSAASYCPGGKVFVGWTETPIVGEGSAPADLFTSVSGKSIPVGGTTYYAVFATSGSSSKTYQFDITPSQFNTTSYDANNNQKSNTATATDASGATMTVYWTSNQIMKNSSDMQWQKNNGYIYNSTDLGTVNSVTITKSAGGYSTWYGTTEHPTSGSQGSGKGFFTVKENNTATGKTTQVRVNFTKTITSYSNYATSCCTPLGTISGSVNLTTDGCGAGELKATWKMLATTGIASQTLRVYDENLEEVTAKRITGITASTSNQTKTISGLNPCKEYYVTVENVSSGGEYCTPGDPWESNVVTTLGYTYTITKNNVSLKGGESEAARACEDFMAEYVANTGYALPTTISVSGASAYEWEDGVLAIEKANVTGNVSVTISGTCVEPAISAGPADANYYVGDSPTPLSVTATLASGTLTYLWKVSTNGGSTWSDAEGTNNAATYSGASLSAASAGTLKFKCIVGNSQGGCTVESGVATITVSNASYFPNGETVFIQADSKDYSAWKDDACVKAWFNNNWSGGSAETTYWLFDATDTDAGKKLFATVVPASGDLNIVQLQRFAGNCSDKWNDNGSVNKASSNGVNTFRSYGSADNNVAWNGSSTILYLYGSQNSWESSLGTFADQGAGVWTATISNYTPDATSKDYKIKTSYNNGWIGNTGSNNNATLSGMIVGSTYNVTATLDVTDHSLVMSKEFVKGTVHFDLQGHGLAISDLENVAAGSKISAPSAPSATGYTFGGWFKEPACTNAWTFASDVVNETMTLYAKWTANVYTITKTFSNVANSSLPSSFTYTGSTTTALNSTFTVDATNFFLPSSIAVTMGGTPLTAGSDYTYNNSTGAFTFSRIISGNIVITAAATAKLKSIAITTPPTTRKYFAGESFSSTGAVVTATMGDGSTKTVSATWTPSGALSAGTSQTVTASYTENGITKTATTTIDVYSVTVNKKNEDGDAIDVAGVTATWTVGTKALAAGVGSTKYAFKEWQVTCATPASTTSASTTLSSPTANVVVDAVFYKPRVIKWSVNGNDSYATGEPTTTVAYNGTISAVPTAPADNTLSCTNKFMGWSTKDAGTTPKTTSYYDDLFTNASGYTTNITAATTTFYAVFAEASDEINWAMGTIDQLSSGSGYSTYDGVHTVTGSDGNDYTYTSSNVMANSGNQFRGSSYCGRIYNTTSLGRITRIVLDYSAYAGQMKVYESDSEISSSGTTALTPTISDNRYTYECSGKGYFIVIQEGSNAAKANVTVYFGDAPSNYVTQCDANIVKVTYDANGGSTSCTNTTTDKTEDYTVCSTPPTRDYYTFAGWLCSADSKTYAASATIDDAVIDADFTLTAQWTPVPYNITYNLHGGTTAGGNPTTYDVETATIDLADGTYGHNRFEGWYSTYNDGTGAYSDQVTSIPLGSHGDITLHAKWTTRHEIVFDADGETTTIYRADDEAMDASVAGQGSVPSDPSAPSTCSTKVFVGWSESEIDDETNTRPGDLMKPAEGKVDENKHYYAVWALRAGSPAPATYAGTGTFVKITSLSEVETDTYYVLRGIKSSTVKVMKNTVSSGKMGTADDPVSENVITNPGVAIVWKLGGTKDAYTLYNQNVSKYVEITTNGTSGFALNSSPTSGYAYTITVEEGHGFFIKCNTNNRGITLYDASEFRSYLVGSAQTLELYKLPAYTYSAYSTSCCETKVNLTHNSPEHGTVEFNKSRVGTCNSDKEVSLTITPDAGYKLTGWTVNTTSGYADAKTTSPAVVTTNNNSAAQNITLTFAQDANKDYDVTATFGLMTVSSWAWTLNSAAIADPLNLYVGQSAKLDVAYTPASVDASKKTYTRTKVDAYINWVGALNANYSTISGKASTGENTTAVTFTHADGPTTTINVKVLPLPAVHFGDIVHNVTFDDVVATLSDNTLSPTKTTPTHADFDGSTLNTCEEQHLHLVGWIREDWPALVTYLNGGAQPNTEAITGAGNDGSGNAYFFAPGASINTETFNGVTFYAVWAKVE